MNDQAIIKKIKNKNENGIRELIAKYGSLLKAIIKRHLYNLNIYTDECFNDVLLNIWSNIESFDESKSSFKNWICAVARYRALNYLENYANKENKDNYDELCTVSCSDNTFEKMMIKEDLEDLLKNLNVSDRELFYKLFYEGFTVKELAFSENVSEDAIYQRVSRARKKIKEANNEI